MLSYRHAFHAGNFADVLKHSVQIAIINYLKTKDKPFSYLDTHSGAGMYRLKDEFAQKTAEYKTGIGKLYQQQNLPELLADYVALIKTINKGQELSLYPGSPAIAKNLLRKQDPAHLFELHPSDFKLLEQFSQKWRRAHVSQQDGYQGLLSLLPTPSRRGLILIDPPYELKTDYQQAVDTIINGYKKFATGVYCLWYPVVQRGYVEQMSRQFQQSNVKNVLQVEFCIEPDSNEYGMTGSGLFIVNPPWQLAKQLEQTLPYLVETLGDNQSFYTLEQIVPE